ncbi:MULTISPECIES: hypothetical protein [unclassified Chryseobacterium]|uniref:hypothetical protein n=1 Tax=unclassified Chryseobacterium TaxID=2593645 RepID=UPI00115935A4|nr:MULTISPECIES: hypothetical protein [unclassified Chryseobacterium]MBO9691293.1 hypothetical protein [Chryseobacterium sp.]
MKKLISILLLSLYLVSTTEVYQLLKIPTLVEHYWEHKKLNPEMSLTAFLKTHYDHPVKDGDYGKDQKLPFIIHTAPLALIFIIGDPFHFEMRNDHFKQIKSRKMPSKNDNFCYKGFLRNAWEPPKYLFS